MWRPSVGAWFVLGSSIYNVQWGQDGDIPVPGDYDGVGFTQLAIWRPSTGQWWVNDGLGGRTWGFSTDFPAPGHYN